MHPNQLAALHYKGNFVCAEKFWYYDAHRTRQMMKCWTSRNIRWHLFWR